MGEIGTGTNIHPKANMGDTIDNDKGDRDSDRCRQRQWGPLDEYECMYVSTLDRVAPISPMLKRRISCGLEILN